MTSKIIIEPSLSRIFPDLALGCLSAKVTISLSGSRQTEDMQQICDSLSKTLSPEKIRAIPAVEATKDAYRKLGKDPNRYRPSAESLLRRIASGKGLYHVNNAVDVLNMVSIRTGFSICGYDADCIDGDISFGIGGESEPYEGIGRGALNIEQLPVFRDSKGAFGTPTSDSVRTMVTDKTQTFLMIFPAFFPGLDLDEALELSSDYLRKYVDATDIRISFYPS